jgi:hypothetical protein
VTTTVNTSRSDVLQRKRSQRQRAAVVLTALASLTLLTTACGGGTYVKHIHKASHSVSSQPPQAHGG